MGLCREMGDMRVATEKAETFLHHERGMCTALGDALRSVPSHTVCKCTLSALIYGSCIQLAWHL